MRDLSRKVRDFQYYWVVVNFELLDICCLLGSSNEEEIGVRRSRVGKGRCCQFFPKP